LDYFKVIRAFKLVIKYGEFKRTFKNEGKLLKIINTDVWKYRSWIGFDTLLVYTVKNGLQTC